MQQAGGLIKLHYHENYGVLELFNDVNGVLYYRNSPLFQNVQISQEPHNKLSKKSDGLYSDGTFIDRFEYVDDELLFDGVIVSREYPDETITDLVSSLWSPDPYLEIGKIDMTYWFVTNNDSDTKKIYENTSKDSIIDVLINNPNNQELYIKYGINDLTSSDSEISIKLPVQSLLEINETNNAILDISVDLL